MFQASAVQTLRSYDGKEIGKKYSTPWAYPPGGRL